MLPGGKLSILYVIIADFQESYLTHKQAAAQFMEGGPIHEKVKEVCYVTFSFILAHMGAFS